MWGSRGTGLVPVPPVGAIVVIVSLAVVFIYSVGTWTGINQLIVEMKRRVLELLIWGIKSGKLTLLVVPNPDPGPHNAKARP